tara:strand:+ start:116 stop:619 length:504 start_codon:yes stop_codon:yes gene_type:complete
MRLKMKTSITFSAYKLRDYVSGAKYRELKSKAFGETLVPAYKKFIKAGKVTPPLAKETIKARRARKHNPSIGGTKPLYDTGKLAESIRYDKGTESIKAVDYASEHIKEGGYKWTTRNGKSVRVPQRDFIDQTHKSVGKILDESYFNSKATQKLFQELRKAFSRRLAK